MATGPAQVPIERERAGVEQVTGAWMESLTLSLFRLLPPQTLLVPVALPV